MKSKFRLLIVLLFLCKLGYSQQTYVPDDNFEQTLIDLGYDSILDDYVTTANISGVTTLNVSSKNISDLTGIEGFIALTYLYCNSNQLTSLDVSQNTLLTYLNCYDNALTDLDVTQNTVLTDLYCSYNQITSLDVTQNTSLIEIACNGNQLTTIDVTQLAGLEVLNIFENQLTSLDVTQNTLLDDLDCTNNELTSLDVSQNTALSLLSCRNNQITSLDVSQNTELRELPCDGNQLSNLDVSQNTVLTYLGCTYNQLTSLDVKNGNNSNFSDFRAGNNPDLTCIQVDNAVYSTNNWTNIDAQAFFSEECILSITDTEQNENIIIYPNPAKERFNITLIQEGNYDIISMNGQILKKGMIAIGESSIDVSLLSQGVYFIHIKTETGTYIKKIILM